MFKVAVHVILVEEQKAFLIRRYNTGWMDGYYTVIAGHLEDGETLKQAAAREAKEEAGIELDLDKLEFQSVMHRRREDGASRIDVFFSAPSWTGQPFNNEPHKCDEVLWAPLSALPKNMVPYVREGVRSKISEIRYSEFGWL